MMIRFILFYSASSIATSSMENTTISGYFTNDNYLDTLSCGDGYLDKNESISYECIFNLQNRTKNWIVKSNNECRDFTVEPSENKGEIITLCSLYGQMTTSTYHYDGVLDNWFLYQSSTEYFPVYGDKPVKDSEIVVPKEQWSIDKTLLKIDKVKDPFALMRIIQNKYNKKQYDEVLAIAKANNIDMSKLSLKTVSDYNNVAFYYQQSGAQVQAISILNTIIDKFPHRDVAYLNLADAYSAINEYDKALSNYQTYIEIMKRNDKANKIPERVLSFVSPD